MHKARQHAGFTLVEVMVAVSISTIVLAGMAVVFLWTIRTANQCNQYAWAQTEAIKSSQRIVSYMRNASAIAGIDTNGNWITLNMPPSNAVARFTYSNPGNTMGGGRMLFIASTALSTNATTVEAKGLSVIPGRKIFDQPGTNSVRMAYRITKPASSGIYPADVDIGVRLRNN